MELKAQSSNISWKIFIVTYALFGLCLSVCVLANRNLLSSNEVGDLAVKMHKEPVFGSSRQVVDALAPNSPLTHEGVKPGDFLEFDHYFDYSGTRHPNETVSLNILNGQSLKHVQVQSVATRLSFDNGFAIVSFVLAISSCMLGLIIGFKKAEDFSLRALALGMISQQFNLLKALGLPGETLSLGIYVYNASLCLIYACTFYFAVHYDSEIPGSFRTALRKASKLLLPCAVAGTVFYVWSSTHFVPSMQGFTTIWVNLTAIIVLLALWEAWSTAVGDARQRHLWLLVLLGTRTIVALPTYYTFFFATDLYAASAWLHRVANILLCFGFGYAILRFRVLNFGFAINRALVFTIVSSLVLVVFSITEWSVDKLLHFEGREVNLFVDGIVALLVILTFHRIQHKINHYVDHTFFHDWYEVAAKLRKFLDSAHHISSPSVLKERFVNALSDFIDSRGVAVYTLDFNGDFVKDISSTAAGAPD